VRAGSTLADGGVAAGYVKAMVVAGGEQRAAVRAADLAIVEGEGDAACPAADVAAKHLKSDVVEPGLDLMGALLASEGRRP
jgi:hypothetical protein